MDNEKIKKEYEEKKSLYKSLKDEANYILDDMMKNVKIKIHSRSSRIKTIDSLIDKVNKKQIVDEPIDSINDIVGLRIICLFRSDIEIIISKLKDSFRIIDTDDKIKGSPSEFDYMAVHIIVRLKDEYSGPRYDKIKNISFEIQLTTLSMHSWSSISHYIDYKQNAAIPESIKKDFYALNALFYLADTQFENVYKQSQESKRKSDSNFIKEQPELDVDINFDTLTSYMKKVLPNRKIADSKYISEAISELKDAGYIKIKDIDDFYKKGIRAALTYEKELPPTDEETGKESKFLDIGIIRLLFQIYDPIFKYSTPKTREYRKYWDE